jgi:hypothetical protein
LLHRPVVTIGGLICLEQVQVDKGILETRQIERVRNTIPVGGIRLPGYALVML